MSKTAWIILGLGAAVFFLRWLGKPLPDGYSIPADKRYPPIK